MTLIRTEILQPFRMKPLCGFEEVKMVFSIDKWMDQYINVMQNEFHDRIWFLGLQGSYGRGEAGDQSDIDVVYYFGHCIRKRFGDICYAP